MATAERVLDPDDERLGPFRLRDADLHRRLGLVVLEGELVLRTALRAGVQPTTVVATPGWEARLADLELPLLVVEPPLLDRIAGYPLHRGLVAVAPRPSPRSVEDVAAGRTTVAVLEGVNDHENVGAVFRNAAAFGVDAVVLDATSADPLYRRSLRVSLGHVLHVPHARSANWLPELRSLGFHIVALTPSGDHVVTGLDATSGPLALVVGAEGPGVSDATLAAADRQVRIPLAPGVDSLNAATAAAIAFHHRAAAAGWAHRRPPL